MVIVMQKSFFVYFIMMISLFGCQNQAPTKPRVSGHQPPEASIGNNVDVLNRGIADRIPQAPRL